MGDATNFFPDDLLYGPEHIQQVIEKQTTPNGVFGTKAHFFQVINFVGLDRLESLYPTFTTGHFYTQTTPIASGTLNTTGMNRSSFKKCSSWMILTQSSCTANVPRKTIQR